MPEIDEFISAAADLEGATPDEVRGTNRRRRISRSRQAAMWLAFKMTAKSLPALGRAFQRHHTTVLYGIQAYERYLANDPKAEARSIELLTRLLTEAALANVANDNQPITKEDITR
ncbi:MAG TPA: helix-turn-helix domain-containing protein [Alphaproteobacteria bacterium]|jgi:chromosomal replication initiator protein|nr:helix-turn-helix domain-containing protein [Alphaproteobacteria bacterium]